MTIQPQSLWVSGPFDGTDLRAWRMPAVMVLALLVFFLSGSSPHESTASPAPETPRPLFAQEQPLPQASDSGETIRAREPSAGPNVDALALAIAKKYRVSQEAMRELIHTAYREGTRNGLDPLLLVAVMAVESRFNPIAQSDGGAVGLMQVIPRFHLDKLDGAERGAVLDPQTNIHLGARILKEYIRQAGDERAGLQLYNGSPDDETNAYASKVLGEKQRLQQAVRRVRVAKNT